MYVETILIQTDISLYGGFSGTESKLDERDWNTNVTVIDGNQAGTVVNLGWGERIDGFTIRNGYNDTDGIGTGGGIEAAAYKFQVIENNVITGNHAAIGGGIHAEMSLKHIYNNMISGNSASEQGSGIFFNHGDVFVKGNTLLSNAGPSGGASLCFGTSAATDANAENNVITGGTGTGIRCLGGKVLVANNVISGCTHWGILSTGCTALIYNNTVWNNAFGGDASGIYIAGGALVFGPPEIVNNIVCFNKVGFTSWTESFTCGHNCVYGNIIDYDEDAYPGVGDLNSDPLIGADGHLSVGSPCINSGDNSVVGTGWVDIDGEDRINDAQVDIGADEFHP